MPIYSMTGFARVQVRVHDQLSYTLSLKSVNHRFLDLQLRLPPGLDALEMELRKALKDNLVRGHVELTLHRRIDRAASRRPATIANWWPATLRPLPRRATSSACHRRAGPERGVAHARRTASRESRRRRSDRCWPKACCRRLAPLLEQLKIMRAREGEALEAILHGTLDRLAEATDGVAALRPEIEQRYQERLTQRLQAATGPEFNRQRLLEEVAVLVERSDISEELTRMPTHIGHFRELLAAGGEVGKKLDFLLQEMNREANTLLSKTGGVGGKGTRITELGLAMKAEIEKAREQIQNVE